ncbi:autotransporter domain-containing protein [Parasphingopyxis sp.]|uniref:autotransporter domain-containing protein n=1 Tax=Parasphingopyxis sp. TaxID=1920299 RepID=UPI002626AD61|nr:autotransporter outer membrane beta-barrel domain-containing protein [Parasphingopyxis sp.]
MIIGGKLGFRASLNQGAALAAIGAALAIAPGAASAQQTVPGTSGNCPIVAGEAICEGDLEDGVISRPTDPDFDRIVVRNPTTPIAPPGYAGIDILKDNGDLDILIEEGVVINVFDDPGIAGPAQGIVAIAQNGFDLRLESAADITADGNGMAALGIEAVAQGGGRVDLINQNGDIEAVTTGDSAIALQGRGVSVFVSNSGGNLTARSNGIGERDAATAGILAIANGGNFTILNDLGNISVETGVGTFDTDFNGIAGAIVGIAFATNQGSSISNTGNLSAIGPQTHGIVGFVESNDLNSPAQALIVSGNAPDDTSISTDGIGSFGILAQGRGDIVVLSVTNNSAIDMTATGGASTGIFLLNQADAGRLEVINQGTITGTGDTLRGIDASTADASNTGDYIFDITNEGDITLDAPLGFGITAFATRDDAIDATINTSGNIDLSATTDVQSIGIAASFGEADATATGDGDSIVTITNSGRIDMGAGVAIAARADQVNLIDNAGALITTGDQSDIVRLGSAGGPAQIDATFVQTILGAEGNESKGIVIEPLTDNSNLRLVLDTVVLTTAGTESNGVLVEQLDSRSAAELVINNSIIFAGGPNAKAVNIDAIGEGSAFTFNISNSTISTGGGPNSDAVQIGGIEGQTSTINVNLLDNSLSTLGDNSAAFIIESFIQNDSVGVLTIGRSDFSTSGDDSGAIIVGSAASGPIDPSVQTITINDSTVTTDGDRSVGISVDSQMDGVTDSLFSILLTGTEAATLGTDSHAIEILGLRNRDPGAVRDATEITIGASENITAAGANSDAIRIVNAGRTAILVNNGATISGGTGDAVAIRLLEASNNDGLLDAVEAETTVLKARLSDRAMNLITTYINSVGVQTPSAVGGGASGADPITVDPFDFTPFNQLMEVDGATVESMMGAGAIVSASPLALGTSNGAIIRTGGDDAAVISASEAIALVASDTTFSSVGDSAPLFRLTELNAGDGTGFYAAMTDITATTTGANSDALALGGGVSDSIGALFLTANDLADPSVVSTTGDGSSAISFDAPDGSTFTGAISRSEISTAGADAAAILLNTGNAGSTSLELLDALVSTTGNGSDVVRLNTGGLSDYTFIVADSELTSAGDESVLVRVAGREGTNVGSLVMIGGTLSSSGDGSGGIDVESDQSTGGSSMTFFIGESSIATEGDEADALSFERTAGDAGGTGATFISYTLDATEFSTLGANSDAFFAGSILSDSVSTTTITNSSFNTVGDNSRSLFAEALGEGSATSLSIVDSVFRTEGANSTALTFNDGSVFDVIDPANLSISTFDIATSTIRTLGGNSRGIDVATLAGDNSTTVITISDNQVSTAGANSDAISIGTQAAVGRVGSSQTTSIGQTEIMTTGDDSRGIFYGAIRDGFVADDFNMDGLSTGDALIFTGDNVIVTSGARSHGMEYATVTGDFVDGIVDIVEAGSTIQTRGDNAIGILFGGVEGVFVDSAATDVRPILSMSFAPLSLSTEGDGSHGIQIGDVPAFDVADNTSLTLTILSRTITTSGDGAHGVVIGSGWGDANSDTNFLEPGSNRFASISVEGIIDVSGAGSDGIVSSSLINDFQITEDGSVTSANGFALNFSAVDEGQTVLNAGEIDGDVIFGGGDDVFDSSGIFTGNIDMGGGANAIFVRAGGVFNSLDEILLGDGNAITIEGDIAPGGDGPLQVTSIGSALVFEAGSRFLVDIDGNLADGALANTGASDRLEVNGSAKLNGGTVVVSSMTPEEDFGSRTEFQVLSATGGVTGMFDGIEDDLPFLTLSLEHGADNVRLAAERAMTPTPPPPPPTGGPTPPPPAPVAFASVAQTPNQASVAGAFDRLEAGATGDLAAVIDQLIFSNTSQALTAFDTASGEIYAALLSQAASDGLTRSQRLVARAHEPYGEGWGLWTSIVGSDGSVDGDGNGADVEHNDYGFDIGIDYRGAGNRWAAGAALGYIDGGVDVDDRLSDAEYDGWHLGAYARYGSGGAGVTIAGAIDYAETDASVDRRIRVNTFDRHARASVDVETFAISGEARYGIPIGNGWTAGPIASIHHASADLGRFAETGAGDISLVSADASDEITRFGGGLFANWQGARGGVDFSAQYVDGHSNVAQANMAFAGGPGTIFSVRNPRVNGSAGLFTAAGRYEIGNGWSIGGELRGLLGEEQSIAGSATIDWRF